MSILYVSDEFRTNPMSLNPGGSNVVVEYHSGDKFGYSRVKFTKGADIFLEKLYFLYKW